MGFSMFFRYFWIFQCFFRYFWIFLKIFQNMGQKLGSNNNHALTHTVQISVTNHAHNAHCTTAITTKCTICLTNMLVKFRQFCQTILSGSALFCCIYTCMMNIINKLFSILLVSHYVASSTIMLLEERKYFEHAQVYGCSWRSVQNLEHGFLSFWENASIGCLACYRRFCSCYV